LLRKRRYYLQLISVTCLQMMCSPTVGQLPLSLCSVSSQHHLPLTSHCQSFRPDPLPHPPKGINPDGRGDKVRRLVGISSTFTQNIPGSSSYVSAVRIVTTVCSWHVLAECLGCFLFFFSSSLTSGLSRPASKWFSLVHTPQAVFETERARVDMKWRRFKDWFRGPAAGFYDAGIQKAVSPHGNYVEILFNVCSHDAKRILLIFIFLITKRSLLCDDLRTLSPLASHSQNLKFLPWNRAGSRALLCLQRVWFVSPAKQLS
jgi:hypothetical protein